LEQGELKSEFAPHASGERSWRCVLALLWVTALAACTSHVSSDLNTDALAKSGDAVIMMTAVIDRNREMSCTGVSLQTPDGKTPRTADGERVSSVRLGTGTILDPSAEVTGSTRISPGTYKVVEARCSRPDKSGTLIVVTDNPRGFATFSVSAGEVVNLGKLIIIEVEAEPAAFMRPARYVYVAHVAPLKGDPRNLLNKDLAARLVDRAMTPSQQPLPQAELARICRQRRSASTSAPGTPGPAACTLAGL
jgi:hypothetical protein